MGESTGGFALSVRASGTTQLNHAEGTAVLEHAVAYSEDSVINAGSVAKQFTALLVLLAARRGKVSLSDPVGRWISGSGLPDAVTVEHLMAHTSGIRDAEPLLALMGMREYDYVTVGDVLALLGRQRGLMFPPATRHLYGNCNYILLGLIAERCWNATLDALAQDMLFGPAGMTRTVIAKRPDLVIHGVANAYRRDERLGVVRTDRPSSLPGASAMYTSASDLVAWHRRMRQVLPDDPLLYRTMLTPFPDAAGQSTGYAAGVFVDAAPGREPWYHHAGHEQGYSAQAYWSEAGDLVVCTTNRADLDAARLAAAAVLVLRGGGSAAEAMDRALREAAKAPHELPNAVGEPAPPGERAGVSSVDMTTAVGEYWSPDLPLPVRLERGEDGALLLRRGAATDRLTGGTDGCAGPGYHIQAVMDGSREIALWITLPRAGTIRFARDRETLSG